MHPIKIRCAFVYKLIFTLYVFSSSLITYSQKVEVKLKDNTEFNRALSGSGAQKIRKAGKYFHKAELTMEKVRVYDREIQDIQNNSRRAKTRKVTKLEGGKMQKEIDAYYFYNQAHKKLYSLYKKSLKQFRLMSANPDEGKQIEKNSSNAYKKSKKQRRKAENKDKTEKA